MDVCKHCRKRIVKINTTMGETWYHQPPGASFMDQAERHCHVDLAEPWDGVEHEISVLATWDTGYLECSCGWISSGNAESDEMFKEALDHIKGRE